MHTLSDYPQLSIKAYRKQLRGNEADSVAMSYQYRGNAYRYNIELLKTQCNYGGYRYWWACPSCSKRVGMLYCAGIYVCRHCIGANYQTQLQQPWQRPDARIQAIRQRLGWHDGLYKQRPKGMHRATHKRLFMEYIDIEDSYLDRIRAIDELVKSRKQ
tara:strand:- start:254 stop:727 length:474 start_codon:yes stop_codon:yes gene_type:complete